LKNLKGKNITIQDSALLKLKPLRSGAFWDKNAGCPHDHDHHHHHGEDCNHDHHSSAHEGNLDGHLWLDPLMMIKVIDVLLPELKVMYPEQAELLEKNARAYRKTLEDLYKKLQAHLALNKGLTYIIQQDGNQYFDTAFGVHTIATISIDPSIPPSAGHMLKIKKAITNREIHPKCLFY
jgi:zinc transport system substrate-binding protein